SDARRTSESQGNLCTSSLDDWRTGALACPAGGVGNGQARAPVLQRLVQRFLVIEIAVMIPRLRLALEDVHVGADFAGLPEALQHLVREPNAAMRGAAADGVEVVGA